MFAAARWHGVAAPGPYDGLRDALLSDDGTIRATILARATQTNEAGRLATLVPAFAALAAGRAAGAGGGGGERRALPLPRPVGLRVDAPSPAPWRSARPTRGSTCAVDGPAPFPDRLPEVAWRRGIDLNPLDVTDADHMAWLTNLVWPEHDDRRALLRQAIEIAAADPPTIVPGDLLDDAARPGRRAPPSTAGWWCSTAR